MENPSFFLEGVVRERDELQDFEGPLNLILTLLQKNKIEIRDIRIADILDQYLAWLDEMQSMDLEIASEFVQMASHLLYIKTKTLLSGDGEVSELELLMASLEQLKSKDAYEAVRQVLPALRSASEKGLLYVTKLPEPLPKSGREYEYRHEPVELLQALYAALSRGGKSLGHDSTPAVVPTRIVYSVRDKSRQLLERLRTGAIRLGALYADCASRSEVVATFLSVLELCSMGGVRFRRSGKDYRLEFVGGDVNELLERIEE